MNLNYVIIFISSLLLISCGDGKPLSRDEPSVPKYQDTKEPLKDPQISPDKGFSLLDQLDRASKSDYNQILSKALAENADLTETDQDGRNILHVVLSSHIPVETKFIHAVAQKAGPKVINGIWNYYGEKKTPLDIVASIYSSQTHDLFKILIDHGSDLRHAGSIVTKFLKTHLKPIDYEKSVSLILKKAPDLLQDKHKSTRENILEVLVGDTLSRGILTERLYKELVQQEASESLKKIHKALSETQFYKDLKARPEFNTSPPDYNFTLPNGNTYKLFASTPNEQKTFEAFKEIEKTMPNKKLIMIIAENFKKKAEDLKDFLAAQHAQHSKVKSPPLTKPVFTKPTPVSIPAKPVAPKLLVIKMAPLPEGCSPEITSEYPNLAKDWEALNRTIAEKIGAILFFKNLYAVEIAAVRAMNSYDSKFKPDFSGLYDLTLNPDEFNIRKNEFTDKLGKHTENIAKIEKNCVDLIRAEKKSQEQKVRTHFGL